jgi:hypothetical protein
MYATTTTGPAEADPVPSQRNEGVQQVVPDVGPRRRVGVLRRPATVIAPRTGTIPNDSVKGTTPAEESAGVVLFPLYDPPRCTNGGMGAPGSAGDLGSMRGALVARDVGPLQAALDVADLRVAHAVLSADISVFAGCGVDR